MRCGFVALIGAPNAGKSTLLNQMVGAKLSIVSPKAQTTRMRILGIVMYQQSQILLVDTPGIFKPKRRLDELMVSNAWTGAVDSDITLFILDAHNGLNEEINLIIQKLKETSRRIWLVLNKIDKIIPQKLLPLADQVNSLLSIERSFMVSAKKGNGVNDLMEALAKEVPEGPWLYPDDDLTNLPDRLLAAELVREQIFMKTHEEIPYAITVETESFKEKSDHSIRVDLVIYVSKPNHKAIIIGHQGQKIRMIGERARKELSRLLERPCHVFLTVKERKNWDSENNRLKAIGLDLS
ncbi:MULTISPECIES: GTPase Era [unclassified Commensalibacter]|uniref:GTPase Era n=1 Tax=unclassified Commensalibacter TaxID=2630218 RepID=UPI0018DC2B95|nr:MULTISPECIES: GTPase Era [unclassified Commensalibacter]MBI0016502.1 GTPase Era [Commensalibacter sp. B14384M2]MBI0018249.1 GTPase Era [Commensalibacter sp. W8133]MBI0049687.1 GTPase Era [Commensalibacter sp. B14384M3]MBI0179734.1 GTPase Era [Commensalibacter sp. W8163]